MDGLLLFTINNNKIVINMELIIIKCIFVFNGNDENFNIKYNVIISEIIIINCKKCLC